jgi:two-component system chemotaxis sensor kinase CheA
MLDMFIYEMSQLLDQLEQHVVQGDSGFSMDAINEIFRIMHTIKGSSAMMMFNNISTVAHSIEDLFFYLREENPSGVDYGRLADHVLEGMDFIKAEISKIESGAQPDGDGEPLIKIIKNFLAELKGGGAPAPAPKAETKPKKAGKESAKSANKAEKSAAKAKEAPRGAGAAETVYEGIIWFNDGCEMENVRAYAFVNNLEGKAANITHVPENLLDEAAAEVIHENGFWFQLTSGLPYDDLCKIISSTIYLKSMQLDAVGGDTSKAEVSPEVKIYKAVLTFDEGSEMENIRAYNVLHSVEGRVRVLKHLPEDILDEEVAVDHIRANGFLLVLSTDMKYDALYNILQEPVYLKTLTLEEVQSAEDVKVTPLEPDENDGLPAAPVVSVSKKKPETADASAAPEEKAEAAVSSAPAAAADPKRSPTQHMISVNVSKLDLLLNLMGELVIAEAMVTQNPELEGLELESFVKEARQLHKIINDIQDTVMSMRMVPLQATFFKMHRIVRDMCRQLEKEVDLVIVGEDTEVDKNIIEHISDPIMHIIRNSVDHGIEMPDERSKTGKPEKGRVILEAKNTGGDVLIIVRDDGAGLNKDKILRKAQNNGLLRKDPSEYSDKEIYQFIFLPGFSTNEQVTSFSGRGVGMDVVSTNLEVVGGTVLVESTPGEGSTFTMKIPLTLAIIEGMTVKMGGAKYTIPIISMKKSFNAKETDIFRDPNGNEMIMERGEVYNVVRLFEFFGVDSQIRKIEDGIMIMLENGEQTVCLFVDELIGEQQVVVKPMPKYIKKVRGISGCTILGNGDISLIIDVGGFFDK